MPKWEKRAKAASRGIVKLWPRIKALQDELKRLEAIQLRLINTKWDAQRKIVPVKIIKGTEPREKRDAISYSERQLSIALSQMTPERKAEFIRRLEGEL